MSSGADYDAVVAQLATFRDELANSVTSAAGRRKQALTREVADGMTDAVHNVGRKGHIVEARLEQIAVD